MTLSGIILLSSQAILFDSSIRIKFIKHLGRLLEESRMYSYAQPGLSKLCSAMMTPIWSVYNRQTLPNSGLNRPDVIK